ncbi:MAG: inverse autotransporter beta domain-containing protein [Gammaproteobacteria bacterium]|nr:inverse autotransporter beta domain-containing protein [Gammaproteobacteria bacterium]
MNKAKKYFRLITIIVLILLLLTMCAYRHAGVKNGFKERSSTLKELTLKTNKIDDEIDNKAQQPNTTDSNDQQESNKNPTKSHKEEVKAQNVPPDNEASLIDVNEPSSNDVALNTDTTKKYTPYIEVGGTRFFDAGDPNYAVILDLFTPIWQDQTKLGFANLRYTDRSGPPFEVNLHLGYRQLSEEKQRLYGVYFAFDRKRTEGKSYFNQLALGMEFWNKNWFVGGNIYKPLGGAKSIGHYTEKEMELYRNKIFKNIGITRDLEHEKAMPGIDAEIGYEFIRGLVGYVGGYYFNASEMTALYGPKFRLTYDYSRRDGKKVLGMFDKVGFTSGVQRDNPRGTVWHLGVNFRLGWSHDASKVLDGVSRHMMDPVRRDIDIISAEYTEQEHRKRIEKLIDKSKKPEPTKQDLAFDPDPELESEPEPEPELKSEPLDDAQQNLDPDLASDLQPGPDPKDLNDTCPVEPFENKPFELEDLIEPVSKSEKGTCPADIYAATPESDDSKWFCARHPWICYGPVVLVATAVVGYEAYAHSDVISSTVIGFGDAAKDTLKNVADKVYSIGSSATSSIGGAAKNLGGKSVKKLYEVHDKLPPIGDLGPSGPAIQPPPACSVPVTYEVVPFLTVLMNKIKQEPKPQYIKPESQDQVKLEDLAIKQEPVEVKQEPIEIKQEPGVKPEPQVMQEDWVIKQEQEVKLEPQDVKQEQEVKPEPLGEVKEESQTDVDGDGGDEEGLADYNDTKPVPSTPEKGKGKKKLESSGKGKNRVNRIGFSKEEMARIQRDLPKVVAERLELLEKMGRLGTRQPIGELKKAIVKYSDEITSILADNKYSDNDISKYLKNFKELSAKIYERVKEARQTRENQMTLGRGHKKPNPNLEENFIKTEKDDPDPILE